MERQKGVKKRIAEVSRGRPRNRSKPRTVAAELETVDRPWLLGSGQMLFRKAVEQNDLGTASVTLERPAKISGCWMDGRASDNNQVIRVYSATPLSEEEWQEIYCPKTQEAAS